MKIISIEIKAVCNMLAPKLCAILYRELCMPKPYLLHKYDNDH